jgi:WD40 repeat protein
LLDLRNGTVINTINEGANVSLTFSPDGTALAATDSDGDLSVWTINGNLLYSTRIMTGMFGSVVLHFGSDNDLWAAAEVDDVGISLWKPLSEAGNEVLVPPNSYSKEGFKFSPNSQILAYQSGSAILLISTTSGERLLELTPFKYSAIPPYNQVSAFKFSENGKLLVAANEGGTISVLGVQ